MQKISENNNSTDWVLSELFNCLKENLERHAPKQIKNCIRQHITKFCCFLFLDILDRRVACVYVNI